MTWFTDNFTDPHSSDLSMTNSASELKHNPFLITKNGMEA